MTPNEAGRGQVQKNQNSVVTWLLATVDESRHKQAAKLICPVQAKIPSQIKLKYTASDSGGP